MRMVPMSRIITDNRPAWAAEVVGLARCAECSLDGLSNKVPGIGPESADIVLVGEALGFHEEKSGEPFVGQAGMLLTKVLEAVGISRRECFITNACICRPP